MPLELAVQFPFSVDTWSTCSIKKPHHFLTHAHSDHIAGINFHAKYPIYCSFLTMKLVLHRHPHATSRLLLQPLMQITVQVCPPPAFKFFGS
ncbi:hypothetical protein O6H91_Y020300 [Diphasiastrum complanatum]|nr:hypothetical protein O6H91_Y020300 [Diphasiastrum complanatum]